MGLTPESHVQKLQAETLNGINKYELLVDGMVITLYPTASHMVSV